MSKPTSNQTNATSLMAVAACSMALTASNELQLLPAGTFSARDGRPNDAPAWHIDAALAQTLVADAAARATPYVIDYEHQTMLARQNGQPAPAAGWFSKLEWREGVGLFATDVQWTDRAKAMIGAQEYRYISPVIGYDKTGAVTALFMAAITNNPAIDGMDAVLLAAASAHFATTPTPLSTQENPMEPKLREQLRILLNLPAGATDADVQGQLDSLSALVKQGQDSTAAASTDLFTVISTQRATIASLSAATPDPTRYVPIGLMQDLQGRYSALSAEVNASRVDAVVKGALDAGKLLPSQEAWAREYGKQNLAALSSFVESAPPIALLNGMQTGGKQPPGDDGSAALTAAQKDMCAALGVSQEDFQKTLKAEKGA